MEFLLRTLMILCKLIGYLTTPILILVNMCKYRQTSIPPITDNLLLIPVVELTAKIRNKEVTSVQVISAYINRIKQVNPIVNAVVSERFEEALQEAQNADKLLQEMETAEVVEKYPLLGIPFTVKESCSLKGMPLTVGLVSRQGITAISDGKAVANLKAAGAIPLLVSNTPIFCLDCETRNYVTGTTLNPHNLQRSSGGSSGGEAALITCGASLFGVGSDLAGSIRVPAAFCGIFGHKPTGGLIPSDGHIPYPMSMGTDAFDYITVGPMCRYVRDLPLLLSIMAGDNAKHLKFDQSITNLKIFYSEETPSTLANIPVKNEIKESLKRAVEYLRNKGYDVQKVPEMSHFKERLEIGASLLFDNITWPNMLQNPHRSDKKDNFIFEIFKATLGLSNYTFGTLIGNDFFQKQGHVSAQKRPEYIRKGQELKQQLTELLGDHGVLVWPTFPQTAIPHGDTVSKAGALLNDTFPCNWLKCPGLNVPIGKDSKGLPIGIQIIAAPMQDKLCLKIGEELEMGFGGWIAPFEK